MQLVIQTGPKAGEQYELGSKPLVLGKDPASEITVPDTTMAARHARFENISGATFVADLESTNGTYLNGQRMSPGARYPLRPDDTLQIGSTIFKLKESVAVAAPATQAVPETPVQQVVQPYQYQIANTYTTPQPVAPAVVATAAPTTAAVIQVQKAKRKLHWPSIIAALVVVIALNVAVIYYINATNSASQEITNTGQVTRVQGRATARPTATFDPNGGSNYKGPTPGIGGKVAPVTPVQLGSGDVPEYPGARRIDSPNAGVFLTQFVTADSFDKLTAWANAAFAAKGWTNVEVKNLPGTDGAVVTGVKGKMSLVTYLLGPGQKDTAPYDSFFKNASVEASGSIVVINITVS